MKKRETVWTAKDGFFEQRGILKYCEDSRPISFDAVDEIKESGNYDDRSHLLFS